jgi:hypothetical protein
MGDMQMILSALSSKYIRRESIVLLDPRIANRLHKAIFVLSTKKQLVHDDDRGPHSLEATDFEYPEYVDEALPVMWCENFTVQCVWAVNYSSKVLGDSARPSMAAVALDMVDMVRYLSLLPQTPRSRSLCLQEILRNHSWRTIPSETMAELDVDWATKGYLLDMFRIIIARRHSQDGWDIFRDFNAEDQSSFTYATATTR